MSFVRRTPIWALVVGSMLFICLTPAIIGLITSSITIHGNGILGVSSVSPLHTSGIYIYNSTGGRVNLYATCFQHGASRQAIGLTDIQKVKALGFNAFRIFLYWGEIQTDPVNATAINQSFFTTNAGSYPGLDNLVSWAVQNNLYVILTLTFNEWHLPPAWSFPGVSFTGQGEYNTAAWTYLFSHVGGIESVGIEAVWQAITTRYKDVPNVLIELFNEPNPTTGQESLAGAPYKQYCEDIITAIEQTEAAVGSVSRLKLVPLMIANPSWQEIVDGASDVEKPNVVWAWHPYAPNTWSGPDGLQDYISAPFTLKSTILHELYLAGRMTHDFPAGYYAAGGQTEGYTEALWVAWRFARCADKVHDAWNKPLIDTEAGKIITQTKADVWVDLTCGLKRDYNIVGLTWFCYCSNTYTGTITDYYNVNNPTYGPQIIALLTPWMIQP